MINVGRHGDEWIMFLEFDYFLVLDCNQFFIIFGFGVNVGGVLYISRSILLVFPSIVV
jgi:hypothetical protein